MNKSYVQMGIRDADWGISPKHTREKQNIFERLTNIDGEEEGNIAVCVRDQGTKSSGATAAFMKCGFRLFFCSQRWRLVYVSLLFSYKQNAPQTLNSEKETEMAW